MKIAPPYRDYIIQIVCYLYILLFVYAAVNKIMDFQNFRVQIAQSPLLTSFAGFVAVAVLAIEIAIALLLSIPQLRKLGLYAALTLMILFSLYIYMILTYSPFVPCSCGGILEDMGWTQHLLFNIAFCILAVSAIYLLDNGTAKSRYYTAIKIVCLTIASSGFMAVLYLLSEHSVHHQNNFVRRYPPFPAKRIKAQELGFESYYFAGISAGKIYLGNSSAPALVTVFDTTLAKVETFRIGIKDTLHDFHNVQLRVVPPNFYLFDGTVPCVFSGNLTERKAVLKIDKVPGFTKAEVIDSNYLLIRTLSPKKEHLLMKINMNNPQDRISNEKLLEKQQDGIFDTDGTFNFDPASDKLAYIYYYRNQYIVADRNLKLLSRPHTIDTTSHAKIKTEYVAKRKQRKFSAPPFMVNRITALHKNLLFVNSTLPGKYDSEKMWKNANVVDVYDIRDSSYLLSFYVYKVDGGQINSIMVDDNFLYVLIGTNIVLYKLHTTLKRHFTST